ncbi:alpha-glucuronidase [Enterococcus lactis]|uniref:alpha-glucuronidase n=1 Tax=Enterococcus TaxID=1350 RepID=UPI002414F216|nr:MULTISPECIES: alpha-glucuronidase [Enterococcus]MDV4764858.1 alpha-glucuronidase [Enterococcus faecium]MDG4616907.1 alpha-glucuronidase [Enterococcus lactis]MEB4750530.1 alpha-glucuronidase [Enterococcus sp. E5-162]NTQ96394.1 alpha-glucuronidase [Enterococcus faecium]HAQ5735301.1 alpha-glucuronidase [Enterococcus faecium]
MRKKDECWLKKRVSTDVVSTYSFEQSDQLTDTIKREMQTLFPMCRYVEETNVELYFKKATDALLGDEGFEISHEHNQTVVYANTSKGWLYGFFELYKQLVRSNAIPTNVRSIPDQSIRMLNHWDNFDGTIERGYAGESIFFSNNQFRKDHETLREYARLLASIGMNAVSINNVNVRRKAKWLITEPYLGEIKQIADTFAAYGIRTFLSINFGAPISVGGLETADPLAEEVITFWQRTADTIYRIIPEFGGFVVKADSEGEPGPFLYGRDHNDGANMLARALQSYGGLVIWRCFVYDCSQDWRDRSIDRAKAAYDHFLELDGTFEENVLLQIKNGPIDFQVREPVNPLFGALKQTNHMLEFQVTQEYTGQQKHICCLLPMWKAVLDFDTKRPLEHSKVKEILSEQSPNPKHSGVAAVVNVGMDDNWTGHKLAQANLFGYGRLIWNNELSTEDIITEWIELTFDLDDSAHHLLKEILVTSYQTYENYTAPLGIGFMVRPNHHYGPDVDGYEYDRWGTYHFADRNGIGVNRTAKDGTGYTMQYADYWYEIYENLATCPDELVLFFHHLPYEHILQSGKTVIQHIYDTHFEGYEKVNSYIADWASLRGQIDEVSYRNVAERLQEQERSARDWKDQINTYFYRKSGIPDAYGRTIYA